MTDVTTQMIYRVRRDAFFKEQEERIENSERDKEFKILTDNFTKGYIIRKSRQKSGDSISFYLEVIIYESGRRKRIRKYIRKDELTWIEGKLAKKKENRQQYKQMRKNVKKWGRALKGYEEVRTVEKEMRESFMKQCEEDKRHINYEQYENTHNIITMAGDRVRSKGECIVANILYSLGIVTQYEPLLAKQYYDRRTRRTYLECTYPDFAIFVNGKMTIIELLGMVDDEEYWKNWKLKEEKYKKFGYRRGENLLCFTCKDKQDFDSQKIAQVLVDVLENNISKTYIKVG